MLCEHGGGGGGGGGSRSSGGDCTLFQENFVFFPQRARSTKERAGPTSPYTTYILSLQFLIHVSSKCQQSVPNSISKSNFIVILHCFGVKQ